MIDNELKQAMTGLLAKEPAQGVDVNRALAAGRSAARVRRVKVVVSCAIAAVVVAVAAPLASTTLGKRTDIAPAVIPTPSIVVDDGSDRPKWCTDLGPDCVDVAGWIAYQRGNGIWAFDPSKPDDPDHQIQLTDQSDFDPLEWSRDGSKLLVRSLGTYGQSKLSVLNADGTQTLIATGSGFDGSLSPDGSQVIYTPYGNGELAIVDSEGGTPGSLLSAGPDAVYELAFSPDGKEIAYFSGGGDNSHTLRVMNSDGTGGRVLWFHDCACHIQDLDWSPDGQRLMFSFQQGEGGVWTIGVDGSDLTQVAAIGVNPAWSPDGTRISYQEAAGLDYDAPAPLRIADADGSHVTEFGYGASGAWNPLPLAR